MLIRTLCRSCLGSGTRVALLAHLTLTGPDSPAHTHDPDHPAPDLGDQALAPHPCPDCDGTGHHLLAATTRPPPPKNAI
ncbi:hypothetical protein [Nocardiopsis tropica]|uniref:Secreted protein n=1 Tax=Nocardiopsis tropica TaxID=109330 RepID=A0ABU7KT69_9ACTN|nr:hypothetical protein [Nocardiopsis umidischolae]MEE2052495.1 hypothetical protein [Nocardiopsis umidischolae]